MINNKKEGISLIVLVITIIVSLILVSIAVAATGNAIENANITEYVDNLTLIRDSLETYYINNGEFPVSDNVKNQGEIIELIEQYLGENGKNTFIYDMRQNEDYYGDTEEEQKLGEFYLVDLSELGIERTDIGNGVKSSLDYFAFSYPSMNIYYLQGMELKNDLYFSLNKRLTYIASIGDKIDNEVSQGVQVQDFEGITITKSNAKWTNDLKLTITSDDISNVFVKLSGTSTEFNLTSAISGENEVHSIEDLKKTTSITSSEISEFNKVAINSRYIEIIKKNNGQQVASLKVSLSNYDNYSPRINDVQISNNAEMSILNYTVQDTLSGISEIRYEYLTKFDDSGNIVNYYNNKTPSDIDEPSYMLSKSKKIKAQGKENISIKVPNNVNKIIVYVIDNAGNYITEHDRVVKSTYNQAVANINYYYDKGFNFSLNVLGAYSKVETSLTNVKGAQVKTYDSKNLPNSINYSNLQEQPDNIELKVKITDKSGGEEVENIDIDLKGNYPYIPEGFYYVGGDKNTGFVISDNPNDEEKGTSFEASKTLLGNQFVWIPVDNVEASSVQNLKAIWNRTEFETGAKYNSMATKMSINKIYTEPIEYQKVTASDLEREIYNNVLESIFKYKGFYVGRYEAGDIAATAPRTEESNLTNKIGIKKGLYVYNYIPFGANVTNIGVGASYLANNMYNTDFVGSNLIFGIEWDQIMKFINKNPSNSVSWGNYKDATGNASTSKGAGDYKTGRNEAWSAKNIYDLAGNVTEWTMEGYSSSARVTRGGSYELSGAQNSAGYRLPYEPSTRSQSLGFRVCLYMKK